MCWSGRAGELWNVVLNSNWKHLRCLSFIQCWATNVYLSHCWCVPTDWESLTRSRGQRATAGDHLWLENTRLPGPAMPEDATKDAMRAPATSEKTNNNEQPAAAVTAVNIPRVNEVQLTAATGGAELSCYRCTVPFGVVVLIAGIVVTAVAYSFNSHGSTISYFGLVLLSVALVLLASSVVCWKVRLERKKERRRESQTALVTNQRSIFSWAFSPSWSPESTKPLKVFFDGEPDGTSGYSAHVGFTSCENSDRRLSKPRAHGFEGMVRDLFVKLTPSIWWAGNAARRNESQLRWMTTVHSGEEEVSHQSAAAWGGFDCDGVDYENWNPREEDGNGLESPGKLFTPHLLHIFVVEISHFTVQGTRLWWRTVRGIWTSD